MKKLIAAISLFLFAANIVLADHEISPHTSLIAQGSIKVPILVYHSIRRYKKSDTDFIKEFVVPPANLEQQLKYLSDNHYTTITFDALADYFNKNIHLPPNPVMINFDDGWENQYQNALPLLQKYKDIATFFIFTNAIGNKNFLSWDEVKKLDAAGMQIGSHTQSHPYLYLIKDQNILRHEIIGSKTIIEKNLGKPVTVFASSYGYSNDLIVSIVKEAGYSAARTSYVGVYHSKNDLFSLRSVDTTADFKRFLKTLNQ